MSLSNRIRSLEGKAGAPEGPKDGRRRLLSVLTVLSERLRDGGLHDRPDASVAERIAMAFERGDRKLADELISGTRTVAASKPSNRVTP